MNTAGQGITVSRWSLLLAVFTLILGVGTAWQLALPDSPDPSNLLRATADCVGAVVLGLAAVDRLHGSSKARVDRAELWRAIAALGGVWALSELALLVYSAAAAGGYGVGQLHADEFAEFVSHISTGQVGIATVLCASGIALAGIVAFRRRAEWSTDPLLAVAGLTLVLRQITGHMSQQTFGSVLAAVHVLAAALWFGLLAALAIMLRSRSDWAAALPRYSTWALRSVVVLTVTGVINAAVRLKGFAPLLDSGYGRIVLAKAIVLLLILILAWWWRRTWVDQVAGHRMNADDSLRRAVVEVVAITVAFGLAAALATTA
ncbi:CopD family protein [Antrihabitans cavernicola]|uniref:CopD family protein n=1 Tax=Antrihabitans cavernicola TaxID=2495913 RepID=A0A5A7SF92_9NOCA|nr:CopD family protein [Spelaeibacter cavernicola]KAA0024788.1 CopD family protein [Spelaeibacter cavernicola]